jgi:hypothetical protein
MVGELQGCCLRRSHQHKPSSNLELPKRPQIATDKVLCGRRQTHRVKNRAHHLLLIRKYRPGCGAIIRNNKHSPKRLRKAGQKAGFRAFRYLLFLSIQFGYNLSPQCPRSPTFREITYKNVVAQNTHSFGGILVLVLPRKVFDTRNVRGCVINKW